MRAERRQWLISRSWRVLDGLLGPGAARRVSRWHPALRREATYQSWLAAQAPSRDELTRQRHESAAYRDGPLFSVVMPVFRPPVPAFMAAVRSLQAQTYERWELCVAEAGPQGDASRWLAERATHDPRLRVFRLETNGGIAANTNAALGIARGEWVAFLDQDDALTPDALFHMAERLRADPAADLLYSDKDNVTPWGDRYAPLLKPEWSPEMLLGANYLTHLTVVRRSVIEDVGPLDTAMDGAQDWDLFLRVAERTTRIGHVPRILYHWRSVPGSCASTMQAKPYAMAAQKRAVDAHLARRGIAARVFHEPSGALRIRPPSGGAPHVTLIPYASDGPRWGERMNSVALEATSDILVFWDLRLEPNAPDWKSELAFWAGLPGVGAAGGRVLGRDGCIERTGLVLGRGREPFELFAGDVSGRWHPAGSPDWYRNLLAVGHGALATPRHLFRDLGGFVPGLLARAAVVDYGLRVHEAGLRSVHVPFVELVDRREPSRPAAADELPARLERYRTSGDPFMSAHLPFAEPEGVVVGTPARRERAQASPS